MREDFERLIAEMVERGVHFEDAQREFERRFIARVVAHCEGNVGRAADALGMHRNTQTRKVTALRIKVRKSPAA